ncbi:MAG: SEC-C metal-binding domain-containing protein [Blautia massiliensis (ex Durand et al. 2017)]
MRSQEQYGRLPQASRTLQCRTALCRQQCRCSRHLQEKSIPNDPCPCGSGKKYKKCCGRR